MSAALEQELFEVVAELPGVVSVYPRRPLVKAVLESVVAAATDQPPPGPVSVTEAGGRIDVALTLGTTDAHPAAETCRLAYTAVRDHLVHRGLAVGTIEVVIATIDAAG